MAEPKVLVRGNLNPATYKTLSHLAVDRGVTRAALVEEAVEAYLAAVVEAKKGGA
jgi:predicted DNA-binding protein